MTNKNTKTNLVSDKASLDKASEYYLGNTSLVTRLVGEFSSKIEALVLNLQSQAIGKIEAKAFLAAEIKKLAEIFSGHHPGYNPIKGYNNHLLGHKLKADLGEYWQQHRVEWNDDPVCVLFDWLAALVMEKVKLADGDDMLLEIMLKPSVQYTVKVLLGIEDRME
jgi:hypothetical protein